MIYNGDLGRFSLAITLEECNQVMSHRLRSTYERYYMPAYINRDCEAIYLDHTRRDDLIYAVGQLVHYDKAPQKLMITRRGKL